ncbi:hypothetical protein Hypma_016588 [Hypsizygus marmoreus]|uniref:Uncharacterized protein n=1 Tax=Hypsizygus marmoreus TaxID=39966 RepID=A0A369IY08_HYPMA|nr:hypothetical protein Hypma_016588 [Hypsizygus marmoreus]
MLSPLQQLIVHSSWRHDVHLYIKFHEVDPECFVRFGVSTIEEPKKSTQQEIKVSIKSLETHAEFQRRSSVSVPPFKAISWIVPNSAESAKGGGVAKADSNPDHKASSNVTAASSSAHRLQSPPNQSGTPIINSPATPVPPSPSHANTNDPKVVSVLELNVELLKCVVCECSIQDSSNVTSRTLPPPCSPSTCLFCPSNPPSPPQLTSPSIPAKPPLHAIRPSDPFPPISRLRIRTTSDHMHLYLRVTFISTNSFYPSSCASA